MRYLIGLLACRIAAEATAQTLQPVRVSHDGTHFVFGETDQRFVVWGVNYDHNGSGELLDEYWMDRWKEVAEDFAEIKTLGANCVRIPVAKHATK